MSEQCKGNWHDYPNCEGCPLLMDSCDGSDEWNDEQNTIAQAEDAMDAWQEIYEEEKDNE